MDGKYQIIQKNVNQTPDTSSFKECILLTFNCSEVEGKEMYATMVVFAVVTVVICGDICVVVCGGVVVPL